MNDEIYWIWLLRCLGPAAAIADMIEVFGSARGVYEAGTVEWRLSGILTAKQIAALSKYSPSESGGVLRTCRENGWEMLTPDSVYYPQKLREIRNFPPVLFLQGDKEVLLNEVKLAMVVYFLSWQSELVGSGRHYLHQSQCPGPRPCLWVECRFLIALCRHQFPVPAYRSCVCHEEVVVV